MLRPIVDGVLAAVLSAPCAVCGQILDAPMSGPVCPACWTNIRLISPPMCGRCGYPLPSPSAAPAASCPACARLSALGGLRAAGAYEGTLRRLVHALKFTRRRSLAARLARLAAERGATVLEGAHVAAPVPLHPIRLWTRGFNQADSARTRTRTARASPAASATRHRAAGVPDRCGSRGQCPQRVCACASRGADAAARGGTRDRPRGRCQHDRCDAR